jgi:hypothetical protein
MAYYKVPIEVWCDWNPAEMTWRELPRARVSARPSVPSAKFWPS